MPGFVPLLLFLSKGFDFRADFGHETRFEQRHSKQEKQYARNNGDKYSQQADQYKYKSKTVFMTGKLFNILP